MTIGERIKHRRKELGLTQEELAKRLGNKSRASVCTVEKDKEDLTTTRIQQYADALECSPAYLMGWEDDEVERFTRDVVNHAFANDDKGQELYQLYRQAAPEIQTAVELLLRSQKPDA